MGFLKSFFKTSYSYKPEDYKKMYFRWEIGGQEYGPLFFDDMITRNWSGPPLEGRFENETKWQKYDYFLEILDNLHASQEQLNWLNKNNIPVDESTLNFREAIKIIENKEEELRILREIEWEKKENLSPTKKTLKKLEEYGIKYPDSITRAEARELIYKHEDKEQIKQILNDLKKRGMNISSKFDVEIAIGEYVNKISFTELLKDLHELLMKLLKFDIAYTLPDKLNAESILDINNKLENVISDIEDAEEQIKDREFSTMEADYKIIGKLPKTNFKQFNKEAIQKHLQGNWDFERDIIEMLIKHFPEIKLKKMEY